MYLCNKKGLHVANEASPFFGIVNLCLKIIIWFCGSVPDSIPQWKVRRSRWRGCVGSWKGLSVGYWTYHHYEKETIMWFTRGWCPTQSCPAKNTHLFFSCFSHYSCHEVGRKLPLLQGSYKCEGRSVQREWTLHFMYTVKEQLWSWKTRWFHIGKPVFVFLLSIRFCRIWWFATTMVSWY